jgi:energy-converting hydrogenase Eha subunit C
MSNRRILLAALALLAAGIVVVVLADRVLVAAVGWGLFGIALVILLSLAFLLVGQSEDRDRLRNPRG